MDIEDFKQLVMNVLDHAKKLDAQRVCVSSQDLDAWVDVEFVRVSRMDVCDCHDVEVVGKGH